MNIEYKEQLFKALANSNRRSVLRHLRDHDPKTVKELCAITGCTFAVTAEHIKQMAAADLLAQDNSQWAVTYNLNPDMQPWVREVIDQL